MSLDLSSFAITEEEKAKIESVFQPYLPFKHDPWGASLESLLRLAPLVKFLFEKYFRVSVKDLEKVPEGPAIFIANHGGQVPIDGMMTVYALLVKAEKNRLTRSMVERWVPSLPFIGSFFMKLGQIVGDQKNCLQLLKNGQSVLVFPEGVKGSGKTIDQRYQLQDFPIGFYRMAIEARVPIIPVTLVGTEETYPSLLNLKRLAKLVGVPYIPITPAFPLLGPAGLLPLPCKISIKFHDPVQPILSANASDREVAAEVGKIHALMQEEISVGVQRRAGKIFSEEAF